MVLLFSIIVLALIFDYINGFHDAANSISTVVTTKVLTPVQAVLWAAFFNFVAFFLAKYWLGFKIAETVSKTVIAEYVTLPVILSALIAAIIWNLATWWFAIPSSSSHTLLGSLAGAAIAYGGFNSIHYTGHNGMIVIIAFIAIAPLIGMIAGVIVTVITLHLAKKMKPKNAERRFRHLQLLSSAWLSITHGLNDSTKVMGVIGVSLIAYNASVGSETLPHWLRLSTMKDIHDWVPFACFTAIALGTLSGGWKIVKTMGNKITKLTAVEGFCSQMASSITLQMTEQMGIPVSTTHVISGGIMGVGAVKRLSAVRWSVTINLLWAWVLTIPVSALLAAGIYSLIHLFGV
ncbi:MAG: inorganic phosphate transporter [Candidatus Symbiothrix sp.]|jgi:PiT family inorganic phosphate transporter|nr:inorganic phosphate transporter [Candidatus Symbiothrix sp.]